MSNIKTYRAVEQGFHASKLIEPGSTFVVDLDEYEQTHDTPFEPNWAVPVDDGHDPTVANAGQQEALPAVLNPAPSLPVIDRVDQPLPEFHPTVAQPQTPTEPAAPSLAQQLALEQAHAENGDRSVPIETTAGQLAAQEGKAGQPELPDAKRSRRKRGSNSIDTGTEPSEADAKDAKEASEAEVKAQDALDKAKEEGEDLV